MGDPGPAPFTSGYSCLIAPGDHLQADYTTPTRIKAWLQASPVTIEADKQAAYGQWIAQLLQNQLGVQLVALYRESGHQDWPLKLREDVIKKFDDYFSQHTGY